MKAWTDYPIVEIGDVAGVDAPIRECFIQSYDGDKYCEVIVGGVRASIKSGYIYKRLGRFEQVPAYTHDELLRELMG